jgi:hypothetical protein
MGLVYAAKGKSDEALEQLNEALKIFEELDAKQEIARTAQNIEDIRGVEEKPRKKR